ncbi:hypothetical protein [Streptomyces avermitilis]|uniref:hypothetical protein n=1 Tax=Streptomyces avermitilis TaxID=33903 RepID=UPI0033A59990
MLRPDPVQRPRLVEIRDNLIARITEAGQEGWLGEIEGLEVSLAGAEEKLAQLDAVESKTVARSISGCRHSRSLVAPADQTLHSFRGLSRVEGTSRRSDRTIWCQKPLPFRT